MSYTIGQTEITVINSISLSVNRSVDELDLTDENYNLLFTGEVEPLEIEINVTLVESLHSSDKIVEEQRKNLKKLERNEATDNSFRYSDELKGHIAVDSVNIPETSSNDTLRRGTIKGIFLPWPKYYPELDIGSGIDSGIGPFGRYFGRSFGGTGDNESFGLEVQHSELNGSGIGVGSFQVQSTHYEFNSTANGSSSFQVQSTHNEFNGSANGSSDFQVQSTHYEFN